MRNKFADNCVNCGRYLYSGQGRLGRKIWSPRSRRMVFSVHCSDGCGCDRPTYTLPLQAARLVDVQSPDGSVSVGYLLADGSLITKR